MQSIALEPTSLGTVLAILAERGENGLHDALLDVLANVLTSNVDLLTVRYRVFKAHRLPGIARILRLVVPDK